MIDFLLIPNMIGIYRLIEYIYHLCWHPLMQSDMIKVIHGYRAAERPSKSSKIPKVSPYTFFRRFDITTEILETTKISQALEAAGIYQIIS